MEIPSQQLLLIEELRANGWQIAAVVRDDLPWWADEVWTVTSFWRPVGLQVFLAFEVDPYPFSYKRKPRTGLIGVHCTRTWPEGASQTDTIKSVGWNHWDRELPTLIESLSQFRDEAA